MSYVTTVIIASDYLTSEDDDYLNASLQRTDSVDTGGLVEPGDGSWGGTKGPCADVRLGSYNYLDTEHLIERLKKRIFAFGVELIAITESNTLYRYSQRPTYDDISYIEVAAQNEA